MLKIDRPLLLLQNRDDNNVNAKVTLDFYKKMAKLNKSNLIRLCFSHTGNPTPKNSKLNKGHFPPEREEDLIRYCETLLQFITKGPSALPAFSQWEAYRQDKKANQYYVSATLQQKFISQALEMLDEIKEKYNKQILLTTWENKLQPLYYALYYANELAQSTSKLSAEIKRLTDNQLLTDEVITNTLKGQAELYYQYVKELYPDIHWPTAYSPELLETKGTLAKFREVIAAFSEADVAPKFIEYFLVTLYKHNPKLLQPLYPDFKKDAVLNQNLDLAKQKLTKTIDKERRLIVNIWRQAIEEAKRESQNQTPSPAKEQVEKTTPKKS